MIYYVCVHFLNKSTHVVFLLRRLVPHSKLHRWSCYCLLLRIFFMFKMCARWLQKENVSSVRKIRNNQRWDRRQWSPKQRTKRLENKILSKHNLDVFVQKKERKPKKKNIILPYVQENINRHIKNIDKT